MDAGCTGLRVCAQGAMLPSSPSSARLRQGFVGLVSQSSEAAEQRRRRGEGCNTRRFNSTDMGEGDFQTPSTRRRPLTLPLPLKKGERDKLRMIGSCFMTIHAHQSTRAGLATLEDVSPADVDAIVRYWHEATDAHLDFLGIDRARLGTPEDTRARFASAVRDGSPDQKTVAFAIRLDGALVGYTLLNRYAPDTNYSHWHIIVPERRAAGISSALYPHRIKLYFDLFSLARLTHQTRTRNLAVNRMLDKFIAVAETRHIENPDGVALPGEFHLRYVRREDIAGFFERA
jgi:RimJ/RimL family protein N-acetyltransferase